MKIAALSIAVAAAAGSLVLAAGPANACLNGCFQGVQPNGVNFNGPFLQGPVLQGPLLQGPVLQGPLIQGAQTHGAAAGAPVSPRIEVRAVTLPNGRKVKVR